MNTFTKNDRVGPLLAVTSYRGANEDHNAEQKFYLLMGIQDKVENEVKFHKVCSFSLGQPDSLKLVVKENLSNLDMSDIEMLKDAISLASHKIIEIVVSKAGQEIWGLDIPTPTELVESFLDNKIYIYSSIVEASGCVYLKDIKDWLTQLKPIYIGVNKSTKINHQLTT